MISTAIVDSGPLVAAANSADPAHPACLAALQTPRIAKLVEQYASFPLGGTDASVAATAERLGAETLITLDRRHFASIRPKHCERFRLLPEI
jgi:predicted nucleic acid-binding protein